jgi:predicted DNA-binding transcriptional regulator YafY
MNMRADRLVATLLVLQAKGRVTAAELATELETSVATARRDLEALSMAGIPVYPQAGRGGGWQLLGGARTDLSGLTSDEARALFLLVGPAASVDPQAKSALRKLVRALPATFREDAEAAAGAVVIDPAKWGATARERPAFVDELQDAVVKRRVVRVTYRAWDRDPVERDVHPWGLVEKNGTWYLLGGVEGAERTYRVDRMLALEPTDDPAHRPADFDLAEAWERVGAQVRERPRARAVVTADAAIVPLLRKVFDELEEERIDDHRSRLILRADTDVMLARSLAGWAEFLTVEEPAALHDELRRLGAALVAE